MHNASRTGRIAPHNAPMSRALALSAVLLVTAAATSCGGTPPPAPEPAPPAPAVAASEAEQERSGELSWRSGTSKEGTFTAYWRPLPDPIPNNDFFEGRCND